MGASERRKAPQFLVVAKVVKPFGVRGEMHVRVISDDPDRLKSLQTVHVEGVDRTIQQARRHPPGYVVKLEGIDTPQAAESLRNAELQIPSEHAAPLAPGRFYYYELVGLKVVTAAGEELGEVRGIQETGSNDVLIVGGAGGREIMIPAIDDVIVEVDVEAGTIVVNPIPGLVS